MIKDARIQIPWLLKLAKEAPCMCCGRYDDTTVAAHGPKSLCGGGMGLKPHDCYIAYLCNRCHDVVDGRDSITTFNSVERRERWLMAHMKTQAWLWSNGYITHSKKP